MRLRSRLRPMSLGLCALAALAGSAIPATVARSQTTPTTTTTVASQAPTTTQLPAKRLPIVVAPYDGDEDLRYRSNTFQPTAADLSLWDAKGRLVWSNNRNLEEEVLSGRLGHEPQLTERFATVASPVPYTLVVSPHSDIAGRFRVAVTSTPVFSDVKLGAGAIAVLPGGTRTGVVEVGTPTRYRVTGANGCITTTFLREWTGSLRCVTDGHTITLPPGVHRLTFSPQVTRAASFAAVPAGTAPDPVPTYDAVVDGAPAVLPKGTGDAVVRFTVASAGTRLVFESGRGLVTANAVLPDGDRHTALGVFVATQPGTYRLLTQLSEGGGRSITVKRAPAEVRRVVIA